MSLVKALSCIRFGPNLFPQVNPEVMYEVFEKALKQLTTYNPKDIISLIKSCRQKMDFNYWSENNPANFVQFSGTIIAAPPRKDFRHADVLSFMDITHFHDPNNELYGIVKSITEDAGIEKVRVTAKFVYNPTQREIINRVLQINGPRPEPVGFGFFWS